MTASHQIDSYLQTHRQRHVAELCDFIRIPSVSALPEHREDMDRAAEWVAERLRRAAVPEVRIQPTSGNPIVIGSWPKPSPQAPTILVYGHYDTQPPDPIDRWSTPPFEPAIRDGRVYGRGATDDKGNLLVPILACEALTTISGRPPLGVTFLFEGEEEIGSPHLRHFLQEHREELGADMIVSADSMMWAQETPSLILGCKGVIYFDLVVRSAASDLHSGVFGGIVPNACLALAHLLTTMVAPNGEITIDGFADGVASVSASQQQAATAVGFDLDATLAAHGVVAPWGEPGCDPLVRNWYRPTLDVNGVHGGFGGEGAKTIIPAEARAKLSCRLVPGQTPDGVLQAIERHIERHAPPEVLTRVERHAGEAATFAIERSHPVLDAAARVLASVYGQPPLEIHLGATLPFASLVDEVLDLKTVMLAWELPDENAHAPDEFFRLENLDRGARVYAELFSTLALKP
jgi:acetylornithine deacetylase/succinyl-diaminopimelate desuccinylase-like protein